MLVTTEAGSKTFALVARYPGSRNPTRRRLGKYGAIDLDGARQKARAWIEQLQRGTDPKVAEEAQRAKEQKRREDTFGAAFEEFVKDKLSTERKGKEVERDMRGNVLPAWKARPLAEIKPGDVVTVIKRIKARGSPHQARNVFGYVKRFFNWALAQHAYDLEFSPCDRVEPASLLGKKRSRNRILSDVEIFAFWRAARRLPYPYSQVYRLLFLSGVRLNEAADVRRREVNRRAAEWIIPPHRMKGTDDDAREHVVPLTGAIAAIFDEIPFEGGEFLFSVSAGKTPVWVGDKIKKRIDRSMRWTLQALDRRAGGDYRSAELQPWVNHDLRRTLRTGLSAMRVDRDVREAVLAHVKRGIEGVYDRYDYLPEKRDALEKWAARVQTIVGSLPAPQTDRGNVVAIAPRR